MLFDSHAHYDNKKDRFEVIKKAYDSGVSYILPPPTWLPRWKPFHLPVNLILFTEPWGSSP